LTKSTVRRRARNENRERAASGVPGFLSLMPGNFIGFSGFGGIIGIAGFVVSGRN
jgi:hypothetical protein